MDRIVFKPMIHGQQQIRYWGSPVGYCMNQPGRPVNFLKGKWAVLSVEEQADVIEAVAAKFGPPRRTASTKEAFDVIDRRNSEGGGSEDTQGAVS